MEHRKKIQSQAQIVVNQRPPAELGYEDGPWKGPGPPLLVVADILKKNFFDLSFILFVLSNSPKEPGTGTCEPHDPWLIPETVF